MGESAPYGYGFVDKNPEAAFRRLNEQLKSTPNLYSRWFGEYYADFKKGVADYVRLADEHTVFLKTKVKPKWPDLVAKAKKVNIGIVADFHNSDLSRLQAELNDRIPRLEKAKVKALSAQAAANLVRKSIETGEGALAKALKTIKASPNCIMIGLSSSLTIGAAIEGSKVKEAEPDFSGGVGTGSKSGVSEEAK